MQQETHTKGSKTESPPPMMEAGIFYFGKSFMSTIAIITKDVRKYWWLVAGGLTAILVLEVLALYAPQLIKKAIDLLAAGQADRHRLGLIAGAIVALALGIAVLRAVGRPAMLAFGRIIERDLRERFFEQVIALPRSAVDRQPAGDIMAHATYDIDNIRLAAGYGCQAAINSMLTLILALAYMIWMSPVLTLLAMVPMAAIPWLTRRQSIRFHQCHKAIQESFSALTEESRDSLNAIRLIKVFDLTAVKDRQFDRLAQTHLDNNMQLARVSALYLPVMTLVTHLSQAVVWGCGGAMAVLGMLTAGDIVAFSAYLVMLKTPLVYSGYLINLYQRAKSSCTRVDRILNQPVETLDALPIRQPALCQGEDIVIKNLTFTYPGENRPVLINISLRLPHGSTTALVGPVGSGTSPPSYNCSPAFTSRPQTRFFWGIKTLPKYRCTNCGPSWQWPPRTRLFSPIRFARTFFWPCRRQVMHSYGKPLMLPVWPPKSVPCPCTWTAC